MKNTVPVLALASLCLVSGCTGDLRKRIDLVEINTGDLHQQLIKQQETLTTLKKYVDSVASQLSSLSDALNNHKTSLDSTNGKIEAMRDNINDAKAITDRLEFKAIGDATIIDVKPVEYMQSNQPYSYGTYESSSNNVEPLNDSKYDPYQLDADGE